jgi:hypothetical protein
MPRLDPFAPTSKKQREIPFDFVLERLEPLGPTTRAMFGSTGVYLDERVICILRKKGDVDDGIWVCFEPEHHDAVQELLPTLQRIERLGNVRNWRKLSASLPSFEDDVLRMCQLLLDGDTRIGKLPDRLKKAKRKAAAAETPARAPAARTKKLGATKKTVKSK